MAIFKCKICGGSLEIDGTQSVATCEYCGTKQTLPKLDDERRANLYDRANHFRRNNDFDKAMGIYENILNQDNTDAEAYWSIVLCRYGIEYVEDPGTRRRVPTVNRAQFTSIFDDEDYKSALANADGYQREIYEAEAAAINAIQKGILAISQKEEPFDVFVCYKETDHNGRRTQDSVLATELYHELTREGFKVFFSRITLEDKLGIAYEPYIFAALHSAKVMVVLGTRPEHFNAVWVKNEWSRYLALIKNGEKKTLIPAYRGMDPYDLPEEFSHLQALDMSKLGFMQDLIRGIKKIAVSEAPKATVVKETVITGGNTNTAPLLKRAFMFLEDGDFDRADDFCEQVLNQDPENARAYLGKLMAELHIKQQDDLASCAEPFDNNKHYQKAVRFADSALAAELNGYIATINDRKARIAEQRRKEFLYNGAMDDYKSAEVSRIQNAIKAFTSLAGYKDSEERIRLCQAKIDQIHIKEENDRIERERLAEEKRIADEKARLEKQRQAEIDRIEAEKRAKRNKKIAMIVTPIVIAVVAFVIILNAIIIPNGKYNDALAMMNDGKYEEAVSAFEALDGYKDSETRIYECNAAIMDGKYTAAEVLVADGRYLEAIVGFTELGDYKDAKERAFALWSKIAVSKSIGAGTIHTVGLKSDGTVVTVGYNDYGLCDVSNWTNIVTIGAGDYHTVGLKSDGTVVAVGWNRHGQCNVDSWTDIVDISAGGYHTVGRKSDGTVVAVGDGFGQCDVGDWADIVAISAGENHTVGLKADGTVVAVGSNGYGQCDVGTWTDIVAISAGNACTVGLKADGTVVAVGYNNGGQCDVSDWTDIVAISALGGRTVGLKSDGTVVAVGNNDDGRCDVSDWTDIVAICAGTAHTIGLKADGTVVAVGANNYGQCEVSGWDDILIP